MRLPLNCIAEYYSNFITEEASQDLYNQLLHDYRLPDHKLKYDRAGETIISDFSKLMIIDEALYRDKKFPEDIWGKTMVWPKEFVSLKENIENKAGKIFDVCVCIYYSDGNVGVDYHSDHSAFGDTTVIPSLSLGAERLFYLRELKSKKVFEITLENASLLIMGENCQDRYEHSLPLDAHCKAGRINLTFRQYGYSK